MRDVLDPAPGVECFRLANPPPFLAALNLAALEMFEEVIFIERFFYFKGKVIQMHCITIFTIHTYKTNF